MSIIQEALKKVQVDHARKRPATPKAGHGNRPPAHKDDGLAKLFRKGFRSVPRRVIIAYSITILFISSTVMIFIGTKLYVLYRKNADNAKLSVPFVRAPKRIPGVNFTSKNAPANPAQKTVTAETEETHPPDFILNGVMYVEGTPQAIINGHILQVGDSMSGATVLSIDKDYVLLNINDSKVKLKLNKF